MSLKELLILRHRELGELRRSKIAAAFVCPDSTPVLFFGNIENASIVTIGINPSWQEFLSPRATPLFGEDRRFLHGSDLTGDEVADADAALGRMRSYFTRSPDVTYWPWFRPVELFLSPLGYSFVAGTAAHTDIFSCFATSPAWSKLDELVQAHFAKNGYQTLIEVLQVAKNVRRVVVMGPRARRALVSNAGLRFEVIPTTYDRAVKVRPFQPVASIAKWHLSGRTLRAIALGPYWNRPLSPLSHKEITNLADQIRGHI